MHPVVRALGKVLRVVGISSPEDALEKRAEAGGPPSWRTSKPPATSTDYSKGESDNEQ
jgi:hypothetical protein